jgi:glycosyltransferase involved in cell wall biosynthesis
MRSFWLFRSDITHLEYYHNYKDLQTFEKKCHDYYLLLPLWLLKNSYFDEVVIWRLTKKDLPDIIFDIDGKKFIQRWVRNLNQTYDYPKPEISFFRGGFVVYDQVTKEKPKQFGLKLYLGAGKRITSQWGGKYDTYLMEDQRDFSKAKKTIPFYKTASPEIFKPLDNVTKDWHFCWPCNFTQINYKGQAFFMDIIGSCHHLKNMKFVHCGNKPEVGKRMAKERGIKNIEFVGLVDREKLNEILNRSFFGLNMSNQRDGCPRISTEILMSGTPLIIRETARLLPFFKEGSSVIDCNEQTIMRRLRDGINSRDRFKKNALQGRENIYSFEKVNKKNYKIWEKI